MAEPIIVMSRDPQIRSLHPLLVTNGEEGLQALCEAVRSQWALGQDFVIDFTQMTPGLEKATVEFRRTQ